MVNKNEISKWIAPLIDAFKLLNKEWDNFFEIGLSEYLHSQTDKYYFTNTFLHRSERVRFKEIYFPIKATYKLLTTNFTQVDEVFDEYKKVTIIGSAGSGKTTLIKHIFLQTIFERKRIPILIELRNLNEYDGDFEKLISEKVLKSKVKPSDAIFKRALESGNFLFLLDGYDEIFSNKKQEINRQIEMFVDSYTNNHFLITTRPGSGIENFPRFHEFKVCGLDDKDVIGFISKIVGEGERRERISQIVLDPKNSDYFEFLRNPLLLSMFIMAFENHPEIPKRKSAFYRNVFDTLYSRHDGITKNSFPREKATKLQRDDFEDILCVFSYFTLIEGQYTFTLEYLTDTLGKVSKYTDYSYETDKLIYDLRTSISILVLDGFEYYFPHRSMQEYFTALFINRLPTDKKLKAYGNLSSVLEGSSTDYSFTFWRLCFELDETNFISNFLIPQVNNIYAKIKNKNGRDLVDVFFDIVKPTMWLADFEKKGELELKILRQSNFENSILDFCEIYDYMELWKFPANSGMHDKLLDIYRAKTGVKKGAGVELEQDDELIGILIEGNILAIFEKYRNSIAEKIHSWDTDVTRRKKNFDNLLDL